MSHAGFNGSIVQQMDGGFTSFSVQCIQTVSSSVPLTELDEGAFKLTDRGTRWMGQHSVFGGAPVTPLL